MDQVVARQYYLVVPLAYTGRAQAFTYHHDGDRLPEGQIVQIPIGRRLVTGIIHEHLPSPPAFATKPLALVLPQPPLSPELRDLAAWMAAYYACSPGVVYTTFLPAGLTKNRRTPAAEPTAPRIGAGLPSQTLTPEQADALQRIRKSSHTTHLIQGVTGSGKTRIYLELSAEALTSGRSAIILVPEITLTQQVVAQFESAFGDAVLTTHSKLTEAKRHTIWTEAAASAAAEQPRVIIGPRSCLFLPMHNLGLIVVDECHESAYKQEQHPKYHAITAAAYLARACSARLVMGSATPRLQELYLAQTGRIEHIILTQRTNQIVLSQAKIIDLREKELFKMSKFITQPVVDAVSDTMAAGRQTLLYINRRGSASSQICGDCGRVSVCPHCALPLTFHADLMRLVCHHCNYRTVSPAVCPECGGSNLRLLGGGTKRIEAEAQHLWPTSRIARLDHDSATLPFVKSVFKQLGAGELDILIGTQMVAKGLDLPAIDTVGVISADTMLHLPDFTAAERAFQLLSQVSGRAGRGDRPGQVFIQTYSPGHAAIVAAANSAYDTFAEAEMRERRALNYPPYVFLLKLTVALATQAEASAEAGRVAADLRTRAGISVTGPAPAFIERSSGKYHWVITVRSKSRPPLAGIAAGLHEPWSADLDPVNLL